MTLDELYMMRRLTMMLDAALPALEAAAKREKVREEKTRGPLRQVTEQLRVESTCKLIKEAEKMLEQGVSA